MHHQVQELAFRVCNLLLNSLGYCFKPFLGLNTEPMVDIVPYKHLVHTDYSFGRELGCCTWILLVSLLLEQSFYLIPQLLVYPRLMNPLMVLKLKPGVGLRLLEVLEGQALQVVAVDL